MSSNANTVLTHGRLVLPHGVIEGSLLIRDGTIRTIDEGNAHTPGAIDCEGDYLLPGLVELHTDNLERHLMPRPQVRWQALPALLAHDAEIAAAGITTVFDALGVGEADGDSVRGNDWAPLLAALDHACAERLLRAEHFLHARCELPAPNARALFAPFDGHRRLALVSLMDHTPGQRQWEDIAQARIYYQGKKGWSDEKFEREVARASELQREYAIPHRRWFVDYCRTHRIALASHDDTTVAHVEEAHAEGVSIAEFPTTRAAAAAARKRGLKTVMGAPNLMRGGSHSGNVAAADLAREGLLDVVSSDYVPASLLGALFRMADESLMLLAQATATVSRTPALAAGLADRGAIEAGLRADLVQVRRTRTPDGALHAIVRAVWREGRRIL